jgi:hypothetical protein
MKKIIKLSASRQASLVGIMLWSAHYHHGQWSREYRMGCRARTLLSRSNEIGAFMASRWFDALERYVDNRDSAPRQYTLEFSKQAKKTYQKLAFFSGKGMN